MTEELKPCPFCGSTYLHCYYYDVGNFGDPVDPCVRCNRCGLVVKFHGPKKYKMGIDGIAKVWNKRVE